MVEIFRGHESCVRKYSEYFSPTIKEEFRRLDLPIPFMLLLLDEECQDITCKHHIYNVTPDINKTTKFGRECANCMCLLNQVDSNTLQDIAEVFGVTRERVRQLEERAMKKVIDLIRKEGGEFDIKKVGNG